MNLTEKFNDLERYQPNQLWMMKDGSLFFITGIDPISKLRTSNKERTVSGRKVKPRSQDKTLSDDLVMFTEPQSGIIYQMDIRSTINMSMKDMRNNEAAYIATLTQSMLDKVNRQLNDYNQNNW